MGSVGEYVYILNVSRKTCKRKRRAGDPLITPLDTILYRIWAFPDCTFLDNSTCCELMFS